MANPSLRVQSRSFRYIVTPAVSALVPSCSFATLQLCIQVLRDWTGFVFLSWLMASESTGRWLLQGGLLCDCRSTIVFPRQFEFLSISGKKPLARSRQSQNGNHFGTVVGKTRLSGSRRITQCANL